MSTKIKDFAIRFLKFLVRVLLAGVVILICAGIIYGIIFGMSQLIGKPISEDYSFYKQYIEVGFFIGLFALVDDVKSLWR